ncbi:phage head closure protein [Sphingobium sp. CECT 9361]|uniref:phage head closure protein n=1 Tax=Sphingobium sp. CECT 9361 TaxID=2845384 RepID=UPI001E2F8F27|nr:phage head closure protein [Sphingobium sp. CECT 9361]CAH0355306.1 hypothetical protein SPH9361_03383 [Sphingobium sp. CECT 9361]
MPSLRPGDLDQRLTLLVPTLTENALNEEVSTWTVLRTIWAGVKEGLGREFLQSAQVSAQSKAAFRIRYAADITTANRARWGNTEYEIVDVTGTYRSGEAFNRHIGCGQCLDTITGEGCRLLDLLKRPLHAGSLAVEVLRRFGDIRVEAGRLGNQVNDKTSDLCHANCLYR